MDSPLGKKLHKAIKKGKLQLAMELIEKGANVNTRDEYGNKPIHDAVKKGDSELVSRLIEKGANINAEGYFCNTALHFAAMKGRKKVASILLEAGSEIEIKEIRMGFTPLHEAIKAGHIEIVELLIQNKANVKAKAFGDTTPLHVAMREGNKEIASLLIQTGANLYAKDGVGLSAFQLNMEIATELIKLIDKNNHSLANFPIPSLPVLGTTQSQKKNKKEAPLK